MFGWTRALALAGVRTEIVCISRDARAVSRTLHAPTGTPLLVVPTTRAYRAAHDQSLRPLRAPAFRLAERAEGCQRMVMELARAEAARDRHRRTQLPTPTTPGRPYSALTSAGARSTR